MKDKIYAFGVVIVVTVIMLFVVVTLPTTTPNHHRISESKMAELINNRVNLIESATLLNELQAESFEGEEVALLIEQEGFDKFVIHYGAHSNGQQCAILCGYDKNGNMLPIILEVSHPCPPFCNFAEPEFSVK